MSDQDMQFADPDWQPTTPLAGNSGKQVKQDSSSQAAYVPRPVNDAWREQAHVVDGPREGNDLPPYAGYAGTMPVQQPYGGYQMPQMRPRARRRSPWLWIILIVLFFSIFGGGFGSLASIGQKDAIVNQNFAISGTPTLVIHETNGDIHVQQGITSGGVQIQADKRTGIFDDPSNIQVKFNQNDDRIDVSVDTGNSVLSNRSVNFTVIVPHNVNLQLQTDSGNINVNNVQGQANLSTASGDITANNDSFSASSSLQTISGDVNAAGDSFADSTAIGTTSGDVKLNNDTLQGAEKINTTSGDIDFTGSVDPNGNYQFNAVSGDINVDLTQNVSFSVTAQTTSGSINADDFPAIQVQDNNSGSGSSASGTVGAPPNAQFNLTTNSGDITLHQH